MPRKLFQLTRKSFVLPVFSDKTTRQVESTAADNIPTMLWPSGRWCLPANIYMLELYDRGHSRRGLGGTLATYASNISHLLRFCFERRIDIHELSDGQFGGFIAQLREDKCSPSGPRVRDDNSVLAIGRNCLDFIHSVSTFRQDPGLIGPEGRIRGFQVRSQDRRRSRFNVPGDSNTPHWHHNSFPIGDPLRRRFPITSDAISALRAAVLPASTSIYLRRRRYAMLRSLEITGGRRIEVASLKVEDVLAALDSPSHELRLLTAKRRGGKESYRYVPVGKSDLVHLVEFILVSRKPVIRQTLGAAKDHGFVFVNERTGMPLRPNTVTQEVHLLAKLACIPGITCPHMFRHRFITKIFVGLIEKHKLENKDDFRRALLDTTHIKQQVQQWTGHLHIDSLDRYIDLAFDEIAGFKNSVKALRNSMEIQAIQAAMRQLAEGMESGEVMNGASELKALSAALDNALIQPVKT